MTDPTLPTHDSGRRPMPALRTAALIAAWITTAIVASVWATSLAGNHHGAAENLRVVMAITALAAVVITAWWSLRRSQDRIEARQDALAAFLARSEVRAAERDDATRTDFVKRLDRLESQRPDYSDGYERGRSDEARAQNEQRGALPVEPAPPSFRMIQGNGKSPAPWRR